MNSNIQLLPVYDDALNQDSVEEIGVYVAINLDDGKAIGQVGIAVPADTQYGYDAIWGWLTTEKRSETPFRNVSDALDGLIQEVLV